MERFETANVIFCGLQRLRFRLIGDFRVLEYDDDLGVCFSVYLL